MGGAGSGRSSARRSSGGGGMSLRRHRSWIASHASLAPSSSRSPSSPSNSARVVLEVAGEPGGDQPPPEPPGRAQAVGERSLEHAAANGVVLGHGQAVDLEQPRERVLLRDALEVLERGHGLARADDVLVGALRDGDLGRGQPHLGGLALERAPGDVELLRRVLAAREDPPRRLDAQRGVGLEPLGADGAAHVARAVLEVQRDLEALGQPAEDVAGERAAHVDHGVDAAHLAHVRADHPHPDQGVAAAAQVDRARGQARGLPLAELLGGDAHAEADRVVEREVGHVGPDRSGATRSLGRRQINADELRHAGVGIVVRDAGHRLAERVDRLDGDRGGLAVVVEQAEPVGHHRRAAGGAIPWLGILGFGVLGLEQRRSAAGGAAVERARLGGGRSDRVVVEAHGLRVAAGLEARVALLEAEAAQLREELQALRDQLGLSRPGQDG